MMNIVPLVLPVGDRLAVWVRSLLVLIAGGLTAVLTMAALLHPYDENGSGVEAGNAPAVGFAAMRILSTDQVAVSVVRLHDQFRADHDANR